jgi:predicted nucleotidyltransferase
LAAGVLKEEPRHGRQRSIKANADYFLYPELSSIARKSFGVAEPLKEALQRFAPSIEEAFVFGSVAKGTDTQSSDVDLAVIGTASLLDLSGAIHDLEQELGREIHLNLYAPDEWHELVERDPVVAQIAQGHKLQLLPDAKTS